VSHHSSGFRSKSAEIETQVDQTRQSPQPPALHESSSFFWLEGGAWKGARPLIQVK
jgi:hypothetical protein